MRPVIMQWDGLNYRKMFDFLTFGQARTDYISHEWDTFMINHQLVKGGLCLKTPTGIKPVPIGQFVFVSCDGYTFDTMPAMDMVHLLANASMLGASDSK